MRRPYAWWDRAIPPKEALISISKKPAAEVGVSHQFLSSVQASKYTYTDRCTVAQANASSARRSVSTALGSRIAALRHAERFAGMMQGAARHTGISIEEKIVEK